MTNENHADEGYLFWKDSSIEHLLQADNLIDSLQYNNGLSREEKHKRKLIYCHWWEFILKNITFIAVSITALIAIFSGMNDFTKLVKNLMYFGINPFSSLNSVNNMSVFIIILALFAVIFFPFLLYCYLLAESYFSGDSDEKSLRYNCVMKNSICFLCIVFFIEIPFFPIANVHWVTYVTVFSFITGLLSNLLLYEKSKNKCKKKQPTVSLLIISILSLFLNAVFLNLIAGLILECCFLDIKYRFIILEAFIFTLMVALPFIAPSVFNWSKDKTETKKTEHKRTSHTSSEKRVELTGRITITPIAIAIAFILITIAVTSNIKTISANITEYEDNYYIVVAVYDNNLCLEPLTVDSKTREGIEKAQNGSSQEVITITSNMLNTKVQKWVSKTDLETIQVTYELNKDSNEDN